MAKKVEKVLAYITRKNSERTEILAFEHVDMPEAGIQAPAGTVESGEDPPVAVLREIFEESGLNLSSTGRHLGRFEFSRLDRNELHYRNVFHFTVGNEIANEWLHSVSGSGEDHKMIFRFFWLPLHEAHGALAMDQGKYIGHIEESSLDDLSISPSRLNC